jgi:hypothetical protein
MPVSRFEGSNIRKIQRFRALNVWKFTVQSEGVQLVMRLTKLTINPAKVLTSPGSVARCPVCVRTYEVIQDQGLHTRAIGRKLFL